MRKLNIAGQQFGRLTAIKESEARKSNRVTWHCECKCGNKVLVTAKSLAKGYTKSCGCLHKEKSILNLPKNARSIGYKRVTQKGYIEIKTEFGFVREHVKVMQDHIGRAIKQNECVHHKDGNKKNNNLENLELMNHGEHTRDHHLGKKRSEKARANISEGIKKSIFEKGHRGRKLNASKVIEIRKIHASGSKTYTKTSKLYGVTPSVIMRIVNRQIWANI